ncbi:HVA1 family protein [uncultured Aquimarina sp.]|uniref:HVA1 family protein n=1 Tax=uncultured Aquimarina sp. TaxID=575652 RepID=UPI002618B824|nr:HVA1 family protein [uncultured Aquimarina sp.]
MIKKGEKVRWTQDQTTLFGIVEETYVYKITRKIKENSLVRFSNANKALYIKSQDGSHVLKNDTEVILCR